MEESNNLIPTESIVGISTEELLDSAPSWNKTETVSRSQIRREWMEGKDLSSEDVEKMGHLFDVFNTTNLAEEFPPSESQIDQVADEVITINSVQDMLEGRKQAIRSYVFNAVNQELEWKDKDPDRDSGYLFSPEFGIRLSKEVSGGKPVIDIDLLEQILDEERFHSITNLHHEYKTITYPNGKTEEVNNVYREVNEEALEKQLKLGNIGMEEILKATSYTKTKTAFYVRKANKTEI